MFHAPWYVQVEALRSDAKAAADSCTQDVAAAKAARSQALTDLTSVKQALRQAVDCLKLAHVTHGTQATLRQGLGVLRALSSLAAQHGQGQGRISGSGSGSGGRVSSSGEASSSSGEVLTMQLRHMSDVAGAAEALMQHAGTLQTQLERLAAMIATVPSNAPTTSITAPQLQLRKPVTASAGVQTMAVVSGPPSSPGRHAAASAAVQQAAQSVEDLRRHLKASLVELHARAKVLLRPQQQQQSDVAAGGSPVGSDGQKASVLPAPTVAQFSTLWGAAEQHMARALKLANSASQALTAQHQVAPTGTVPEVPAHQAHQAHQAHVAGAGAGAGGTSSASNASIATSQQLPLQQPAAATSVLASAAAALAAQGGMLSPGPLGKPAVVLRPARASNAAVPTAAQTGPARHPSVPRQQEDTGNQRAPVWPAPVAPQPASQTQHLHQPPASPSPSQRHMDAQVAHLLALAQRLQAQAEPKGSGASSSRSARKGPAA